jgi:SAM-dependent methyltransferase
MLNQRCRQPEVMDQPDLARQRHFAALGGLERLNFWSGSARILWPPVRRLLQQAAGQPIRLLDIATGAGDLPIALWRRATRRGWPLQVDAWDVSPAALDYARQRAADRGATIGFHQADALTTAIPSDYDVVFSSLFLHHLDDDQAIDLLRRMAGPARRLVLVNDLVRCLPGLLLAHLATRLLTTSDVVHTDGPLSVQAAFSLAEVAGLARTAGLNGATVVRRWPFRYLLTWERSP